MLDFPKWKIWAVMLPILLGILLAIPSMMPASAGGQAARLDARRADQPRARSRRRQPLAARGRFARRRQAAACGQGRGGHHRPSPRRSADRDRRRLDRRRPAELHGPRFGPGRCRGRTDARAEPAGRPQRQPRLGRPRGRFDPHRTDPDRGRQRPRAQGCDDRRARRRPPPHRSAGHQGNHRHQPGRAADPRPGARRRGSRSAEGADRPDRAARIQARRSRGRPQPRRAGPRAGGQPGAADGRWRRDRGQAPRDGVGRPVGRRAPGVRPGWRPRHLDQVQQCRRASASAASTQENVGKPFAIILDDKVLSAPNIKTPILGGQAQISGNFTVESANALAVVARQRQAAGQAERHGGTHDQRRPWRRFDRARASSPRSPRRSR